MSQESQEAVVDEKVENPAPGETTPTPEVSEIDKARQEIESLKDSWTRERAEFQNYKRRTANDLLNVRKETVKRFAENLLSPLDNMERVVNVKNPSEELKPFLNGVLMIQKEFLSVLEKENIYRLDPIHQSFDPIFMEAIASEEREEITEEIVVETYQFGFYHQDGDLKHSIRPARVKVAKPKSN